MPTLDWLDRQTAFSVANNTATHVLRPHATGHVFGDAAAARDNLLIQGDNLQALKALLPFYRGQVKCIFIDPPYNTKSAFEHYDDFFCELTDDRVLVVEYKGSHISGMPKEIEKGQVGTVWAERSGGKALFAMVFKNLEGMGVSQQLDAAVA
jgi:16S rRNA G966 N2-methylase RsmD